MRTNVMQALTCSKKDFVFHKTIWTRCKLLSSFLLHRRTNGGQARGPVSARDFLDTGNAPQRHGKTKPHSSNFEDHFHGAVDLEGEFEEDDARGRLVSVQQRDFLQEVDRSRREQLSSRVPRTGLP